MMHCMRCHGLTVPDHLFDRKGTNGHILWRRNRRCMNCGQVDDAGIGYGGAKATQAAAFSSEPDYHDEEVHLGMEAYLARTV